MKGEVYNGSSQYRFQLEMGKYIKDNLIPDREFLSNLNKL